MEKKKKKKKKKKDHRFIMEYKNEIYLAFSS